MSEKYATMRGNKNASKGKENYTAQIKMLLPEEEKGLIKQWLTGDNMDMRCAPTCLDYLLVLVEFAKCTGVNTPDKLKQVLDKVAE